MISTAARPRAGEERRLRAVAEPRGERLVEEPVASRQPPPADPREGEGETTVRGGEHERDDRDPEPRAVRHARGGEGEGVSGAGRERGGEIDHGDGEACHRQDELEPMVAGRVGHVAL